MSIEQIGLEKYLEILEGNKDNKPKEKLLVWLNLLFIYYNGPK